MKKSRELLLDEIALRRASIGDAKREYSNGDLTESEFRQLIERDEAAIRQLERDLESAALVSEEVKKPRRRRRGLLLVAITCFLLAALGSVVAALSIRQAGSSDTGNVSLSRNQKIHQLSIEAEADLASGSVTAAMSAYQQVLQLDPKNAEALIQSGWLTFSAASTRKNPVLVQKGISLLSEAIKVAPLNPAAHLYYAIVAASTSQGQRLAREQFKLFLRLNPSEAQRAIAEPFLTKYHLATK